MPKKFKSDKEMKRGDIEYFSSGGISCVKWMDNRAVLMLSNFISPVEKSLVKRRKAGSAEKIYVTCPEMFMKYNRLMGGVDLMDQMKTTYQYDRKSSKKFYLRLFFDLMDIAMNNACIVYNQILKINDCKSKEVSNLDFRQEVAMRLIGSYSNRSRSTSSAKKFDTIPAPLPTHKMKRGSVRMRCQLCSKKKIESRINTYCDICDAYLCFNNSRDCFTAFHSI